MRETDPACTSKIKLVQEVQKYPCIYDCTLPGYAKREVSESAWDCIAKELKDSVPSCKERWKNLRTAFAYSLKKSAPGSKRKKWKDYYLKDALRFLIPHIKSGSYIGNMPSPDVGVQLSPENEYDSELLSEHAESVHFEIVDELSQEDDRCSVQCKLEERETRSPNITKVLKTHMSVEDTPALDHRLISQETDMCFAEYMNSSKTLTTNASPDLDFLKSLLPDISKMNDYQKRQFKKRTLDVIDTILCDGPSSLVQSPSTPVLNSKSISAYSNNVECGFHEA